MGCDIKVVQVKLFDDPPQCMHVQLKRDLGYIHWFVGSAVSYPVYGEHFVADGSQMANDSSPDVAPARIAMEQDDRFGLVGGNFGPCVRDAHTNPANLEDLTVHGPAGPAIPW